MNNFLRSLNILDNLNFIIFKKKKNKIFLYTIFGKQFNDFRKYLYIILSILLNFETPKEANGKWELLC